MILPRGSIMIWNRGETECIPTEHSRSPLTVSYERIAPGGRMADGVYRGYYVADKRTWSTSWTELPAPSEQTVDNMAGGSEMEDFYYNTRGEFLLTIRHSDSGLNETVPVRFSDFSKSHVKRGSYDMWDLSVSLEEI